MCDDTCEDILKLKQFIIDGGFYDAGMSVDDMKQMYKTLNRSKQTANNEIEYRELLSQTDLNCSNVDLLKTEVNDIDATDDEIPEVIPSIPSNSRSRKLPKRVVKTDIDFNNSSTSNYKPIVLVKQSKNICPILYHHPAVLKLPVKERAEIILLYLQNQLKRIRTDEIQPPVSWCKPIVPHPSISFNNDLCVETEPEIADNTIIEKNESTTEDFITLKSRRIVKRKNYGDIDSDEELTVTLNKKIKSNNTVDKNVILEKLCSSPSTSSKSHSQKEDSDEDFCPTKSKKPKSNDQSGTVIVNKSKSVPKSSEITSKAKRWFPKMNVSKLFSPEVTDRTNKLFDKLKEDENKKKPKVNSIKLDDISDLSDCEDIFPTKTNIHNETTPKLKKGKVTTKKTQTKSRKKLNLKTTNEESNAIQIPATNFYGKNKENEIDASNNNKSTTSKMTQCPICFRSFPNSEIVEHASLCDQFDNSEAESLCDICNKYILNVDMDAHKFLCLETITEGSTEKTYEKNTTKSNLGFLCDICDKFVVDCNQLDHASNCIAIVKDD